MSPRLRNWLWAWGPVLGYMALVFIASSMPVPRLPLGRIRHIDKVMHCFEYGLLCLLLIRALRSVRWTWMYRWTALIAFLATVAYGASDEWHQSFTGRTMDFDDWLADVVGSGLAAIACWAYFHVHADPREEYAPGGTHDPRRGKPE